MSSTEIQLFTAEQHASDRDHVSLEQRHARRVSCLSDPRGALTERDACTARNATPIDEGHVFDTPPWHMRVRIALPQNIRYRRLETPVECTLAIGYVAGADAAAHRSTALPDKGMQGPGTIPRDASITRVSSSAACTCVDKICNTLLNKSFFSCIGRNRNRYGSVLEHGYKFIP